jgi:hypothetical protein
MGNSKSAATRLLLTLDDSQGQLNQSNASIEVVRRNLHGGAGVGDATMKWRQRLIRFLAVLGRSSHGRIRVHESERLLFARHDQYTTIVRSKPSQMVLNHPK